MGGALVLVVVPLTTDSGQQFDLFGHPARPSPRRPVSWIESNDVELMVTVAANAVRCGYLLVGAAERVYARTDADGRVARVPRYEQDAVHQLLRRRWLTLGSTHRILCGAAHLIGTAVVVPKATRERIERWNRLQRPPAWPGQHHQYRNPSGEPVCALCQGTGRVPDSGQTRWSPDRGIHRPHTTRPCHWCQHST